MAKQVCPIVTRIMTKPGKIASCLLLVWFATGPFTSLAADDFGTLGIRFEQLYDDAQPGQRGALVVLDVVAGLPGAKAGVHKGDIVFAFDGIPVMGHALDEIDRKSIRGPVGSTVRLSFVRLDGSQFELTLERMPYPAVKNPASDPFSYSVSGSWRMDPRYNFPLPWAPSIAYHGIEDVAFSPDFDHSESPEYHSYLFFWWLEGSVPLNPKQLESDMVPYFQGLAEQRGRNHGFTPHLSQITARYNSDASGLHNFGGVAASSFQGMVSIYDPHGKVIQLNSEVVTCVCPGSNHTAAFFGMSEEPRYASIWKQIDAVRDSFRCSR
jgi:PDZ domain